MRVYLIYNYVKESCQDIYIQTEKDLRKHEFIYAFKNKVIINLILDITEV